ncbi:MAG: hypothetical protein WA874_08355, partial [Chryseosolibacter sp.]
TTSDGSVSRDAQVEIEKLPQVTQRNTSVTPVEDRRITLTINGYDADSKSIIERINLWNNYETRRRVVGQVRHGEKVVLLKRMGDGVFIETSAGVRGWLTYWFIKEYEK